MNVFALSRCVSAILLAQTCSLSASEREAKLLQSSSLPPFDLANFGYTADELDLAAANGLVSADFPAIGSGLQRISGNFYLSVTDRGPTPDRIDGAKAFPLPQFTPMIVLSRTAGEEIIVDSFLPILNDLGQGVTGIPNGPADDALAYPSMTSMTPLPPNPDALDPEDVHTLPGGGYILVEEYSPSVAIVGANGHVLKRYTPAGKTLPGANYLVADTLPAFLNERRANRGFESIAVSADGCTAYTLTQSPLGSTQTTSPYRNSTLLRILRMDISNPLDLHVTGQFVYLMDPVDSYPSGNTARDLKVSAAAWVAQDKLLLLERTDRAGAGAVRLIMVDLSSGNMHDHPAASAVPLILENTFTDLALLNIHAVAKQLVLDLNTELPQITDYKLEGLTILNRHVVTLSNDNDFGMLAPTPSTFYRILLSEPLW